MIYEYWLASIKALSDRKKRMLREECGSGKEIYYIEEKRLFYPKCFSEKDRETIKQAKREIGLETRYRELEVQKIRFIPYFDAAYPGRLNQLSDPPYALYVKGELPGEDQISASIVGARRCTYYGEAEALEYGEALARAGIQVISGMARGIDGAGHRGALNGGGRTYAVLGCGVDICYPREHIGLYMDIQEAGGVISELCPGDPPLPFQFPKRNRIISGLSDVILVIEAKERSGSLITADLALEQGKDVYALPGPVTSPLSEGCHRLIRQGAGILISPADLLEELNLQSKKLPAPPCGKLPAPEPADVIGDPKACKNTDKNKIVLETQEKLVYSCLDLFPKSADELIQRTGMSPGELLQVLTALEIDGCIKEISKNYYIRVR